MNPLALLLAVSLAAPGMAPEPDLRAELKAAFQKGSELFQKGKHADGMPLLEKAAALAPKVYGVDHLHTAAYWHSVATAHMAMQRHGEAKSLLRKALAIREKKLGHDPKVADTLNMLGLTCHSLGERKEAEALHRRALAIREAKLGKDHADVATSAHNLASELQGLGRYKEAEPFFRRALAIREANPKQQLDVATSLHALAHMLHVLGRFKDAEPLLSRALAIREAALGKNDPELAGTLNVLAELYKNTGRLDDADATARRALQIRERAFGPEHPSVALCLSNVGNIADAMGNHAEAERLFRRSLAIYESKDKLDSGVVGALNNLAGVLRSTGRFREAEVAFRRCLQLSETIHGKDHPGVALVLNNMGMLYYDLGRHEEAGALFTRSLRIYEAAFGKEHEGVGNELNSLAGVYIAQQRYKEAEAAIRRCIAIRQTQFGDDHPAIAVYWNNLAVLCMRTNRFEEAERLFVRSLRSCEKHFGTNHPSVAGELLSLGDMHATLGHPDKAIPYAERSLRILGKKQREHPASVANIHHVLAGLYQAGQDSKRALHHQQLALAINEKLLHDVLSFSSESAMHAFLESMDGVLPQSINLAAQAKTDSAAAAATAYTWTLRLKGMALDTLCKYRQTQHRLAAGDPLMDKVQQYRSLKQRLANAALNAGAGKEKLDEQLARWRKQADDLEAELNRAFAERTAKTDDITVPAVQKRLPAGSALVEFLRAPIRDFQKSRWHSHHYFAFVVTPGQGSPRLFDLGQAAAIDAGVEAVGKEFSEFQEKLAECEFAEEAHDLEKEYEKRFRKVSAALHARLLGPLRDALGKAELLFLAPDGALNRLPFEALVDGDGKYLAESRRCAYLSSGRDLLRPASPAGKGTAVFAGPDYGMDADRRLARAKNLLGKTEMLALRGLPGQELRSVGWKALAGAAAEAGDIDKILSGSRYGPVRTFVGPDALEEVLKSLTAPRVLHLATHGFFLDHEPRAPQDDTVADNAAGVGAGWARGRLKRMDNPLLRSGIVLAGANAIASKGAAMNVDDGWVTAEEIALLNLHGTELVVLSACQTGLGEVKSGEGVFGLRRAFLFAGARTLLTSLFEVPDRDTRLLMAHFYRGLQSGQGKLSALHAAQREMIRQRRTSHAAAHPFFWASFVLVGDPN